MSRNRRDTGVVGPVQASYLGMPISNVDMVSEERDVKGATCAVCGEAFIPQAWQRDRGMLLCEKHLHGRTGDPRDTADARRLRAEMLSSNPPCHWCGEPATTIDEVHPIIKGGVPSRENSVPACERCNKSRQERPGPPKGMRLR